MVALGPDANRLLPQPRSKALAGPGLSALPPDRTRDDAGDMMRQDADTTTGRTNGMPSQQKPRCVSATRPWVRAGFAPSERTRDNAPSMTMSMTNRASDRAARHEHPVSTKPRHPRRSPTRTWVRAGFAPSERTRTNAPSTTNRVVLQARRHDNRVRLRTTTWACARRPTSPACEVRGRRDCAADRRDCGGRARRRFQRRHSKARPCRPRPGRGALEPARGRSRAAGGGAAPTRTGTSGRGPCPGREGGDVSECSPRERSSRATRKTFADTLCAPTRPRAGTGPQRRAQRALELRRKQALCYLNLSCP